MAMSAGCQAHVALHSSATYCKQLKGPGSIWMLSLSGVLSFPGKGGKAGNREDSKQLTAALPEPLSSSGAMVQTYGPWDGPSAQDLQSL